MLVKKINYTLKEQSWLYSKEREYLYALLASLFRVPPTSKVLEKILRSVLMERAKTALKRVPIAKAEQTRQALEKTLLQWEDISVEREMTLQQEFASLFLNYNRVSLYESDYLCSEPYRKDIVRDMLRLFYEIFGHFKRRDVYPPDHLSVELDFIAALIKHGACNDNKYRDLIMMQSIFINEHLGCMIPLFSREIEIKGQPGMFYYQVAQVTKNLIELDQSTLGIRVEVKTRITG